jgi:hypothetical protein
MTSSVLSTRSATDYQEFMWWWLHHSDDPERLACMLGSYFDESAIDGSGPASAVGGLILDRHSYGNLAIDWEVALEVNKLPKKYIHMKDFGQHGELASFPVDKQRALFFDLATVINEHKYYSVGSTLTPSEFKRHQPKLPKKHQMTIHGTCFVQAAMIQARIAEHDRYPHDIPFMLDRGCPDRKDVDTAHTFLSGGFPDFLSGFPSHAGGLTWENDEKFAALQAADVIAWAVRRRAAGESFGWHYEPLLAIINIKRNHFELKCLEAWMVDS